ncbi:hypothetical protein KEM55_003534 [Ascosphaera atra]|nr:hypothetical protein KEM55_003534 [Ascosphaera atra]
MSALGRVREKFLDGLSEKYIYGRLPLLHALVFLIELVASMRLFAKFNAYYAQRPVLTTMVTNAVLGGVADTVAQSITAIKSRTRDRSRQQPADDHHIAIEFRDLTKEQPATQGEAAWLQPGRRFDFERLARFMAWGFLMAPVQLRWYGFLSRVFPMPKGATGTAGAGAGKAGLGP